MFIHSVSERRYSAKHIESRSQDEIYCTWVINEVEKMFVHNVSKNISTCLAMHVKSMLLRIMILKMQEMHLIIIIIIIHTLLWHWLNRLMRKIYAMCVEWTKLSEV